MFFTVANEITRQQRGRFILSCWLSCLQFLILVLSLAQWAGNKMMCWCFSGFHLLILYVCSAARVEVDQFSGRGNKTLILCSDWQVSELAQIIKSNWWICIFPFDIIFFPSENSSRRRSSSSKICNGHFAFFCLVIGRMMSRGCCSQSHSF